MEITVDMGSSVTVAGRREVHNGSVIPLSSGDSAVQTSVCVNTAEGFEMTAPCPFDVEPCKRRIMLFKFLLGCRSLADVDEGVLAMWPGSNTGSELVDNADGELRIRVFA